MPLRKNKIARAKDGFIISFLNESNNFRAPFDWKLNIEDQSKRLWLMNLHYMEYLEEVSNNDFELIVNDWIKQNPPYEKNFDWAGWNSYVISLRTVVWMQQFEVRKDFLSEIFKQNLLQSLFVQVLFLEKNLEKDIGGNHLIKNVKALILAGSFFDGQIANRWKFKGESLLADQIEKQILIDGVHFELSPSYHCQVFVDLLESYSILSTENIKSRLKEKLIKMAQVIADLTHPDGYTSIFNDGSLNMSYLPDECLNAFEKIIKEKIVKQNSFEYNEGGYYGLSNSQFHLVIDAGRVGADFLPAHSHGDIFSFELSIKDKRFFIDPGVFEYNAGDKRNYSRSTKAHNTLTIDDEDQCEFYDSFRLAKRADVKTEKIIINDSFLNLSAEHNGYKKFTGNPIHKREFLVNESILKINDIVIGGNGQTVCARLLLHPECRAEIQAKKIIISRNDESIILYCTSSISIIPAKWFPDFGVEIDTKQIVLEYGIAPCEGEFSIELVNEPIGQGSDISKESEIISA